MYRCFRLEKSLYWRGRKKIALILIAALFLTGWTAAAFQVKACRFPQVPKPVNAAVTDLSEKRIQAGKDFVSREFATGRTNYRNKELLVDETFTSNLPLVIISTGEQRPGRGVVWDSENHYFVPIEEAPYAYGV
jgi:hypothetical protein